jgi:chloramphenicol O-acetyltransferase type B
VDVSKARKLIKDKGLAFSITMTLLVTQAANDIDEFRHRVVKGEIEEYNFVIPLYTVLTAEKSLLLVEGTFSGDFKKDYADNLVD